MKLNKLLLGSALISLTIVPTMSMASCSKIEGIKNISTKFEVRQDASTTSWHNGILTINLVYNSNIKSIKGYNSYIINGPSVIIETTVPASSAGSHYVEGQVVATAIDDSIYTILYSMNTNVVDEGTSSTHHYYVSSISNLEFWDPTKI